jgi:hypothetical protein
MSELTPERLADLQRNYDDGFGCSREVLGLLLKRAARISEVEAALRDVLRRQTYGHFATEDRRAPAGCLCAWCKAHRLAGLVCMNVECEAYGSRQPHGDYTPQASLSSPSGQEGVR